MTVPPMLVAATAAFVTVAAARAGGPLAALPVDTGEMVITTLPNGGCGNAGGYGMDPSKPVVILYDVRVPPVGANPVPSPGTNWPAPAYSDPSWTPVELGLVFGLALDGDASPNIHVAATTVYGDFSTNPCGLVPGGFGPAGPGGIYRLDGTGGGITPWVVTGPGGVGTNEIPNTGPALGNICYDAGHDQFFVTNHEDGKLYRIDPTGTILSVHDPFAPDGGTPGFAPLGERLWGVGVYDDRLYFSVWLRDQGRPNTPGTPNQNSIWSIALDGGGDFLGTEMLEITLPVLPAQTYSNPVSDIAFSPGGKMLVSEHTMFADFGQIDLGHSARVLEYVGTSGNWSPSATEYWIGSLTNPTDPMNASGGIDYDCDLNVWGTGDVLLTSPTIYGVQRVPFIGNLPTSLGSISYHVGVGAAIKGGVGDVEVHVPDPCDTFSTCVPGSGPCGTAHTLPGCDDPACCEIVCNIDPYCCAVEWVAACAQLATDNCMSCVVECQPGDVLENEACGSEINHGCKLLPPLFSPGRCGWTICGRSWADNGARDRDWYELDVPDSDGDGYGGLRVTLTSEIPAVVRIHNADCANQVIYAQAESAGCQPGVAEACLAVPPGVYLVSVKPETLAGGPVLNGYPCGSPNTDYRLELACFEPCDPPAGPCVPPPKTMTAWFPLDELSGAVANEVVHDNDGNHVNGPAPLPGEQVDNALCFNGIDQYVDAPDAPQLDVGTGDFSVDMWVMPEAAGGGVESLLDKRATDPAGLLRGYHVFLDGGLLGCQLADGGFTNYTSGTSVPPGGWHHVAVTVDRDAIGTFYLDGAAAGTFNPTARSGSLNNAGSLRLASRSPSVSALFTGCLDEVELFKRVLGPSEVAAIYSAGPSGKCKLCCYVPRAKVFCNGADQISVKMTVCNKSAQPHDYQLSLQGLPASSCGNIAGPSSFTIGGGSVVSVPAASCVDVTVQIDRPAGMTAHGDIGCYELTVEDLDTGQTVSCQGKVADRREWCAVVEPGPGGGLSTLTVGEPLLRTIQVSNIARPVGVLTYRIQALEVGTGGPADVSLDGLPPGKPVERNLTLEKGAIGEIEVLVEYTEFEAFRLDELVFLGDDDGDGVVDEILDSTGLRSLPAVPCPADVAGDDGVVGVLDFLALLAAWSSDDPQFDIDGDGLVSIGDFLLLLANWGPCPD